jgi:gliding motility-associated-like protein
VEVVYTVCDDNTPANCTQATLYILVQSGDSDGDGVLDLIEFADGTDPNDPCDFVAESQDLTLASDTWLNLDCDGDGVTNGQEILDGTNPVDVCDYDLSSQNLADVTAAWLDADCDGDGVTNGQELIDGTDPSDNCSSVPANVTLPFGLDFLNGDCDGDGLTNAQELGDNPQVPFDSNGNGIPDYLEVNIYSDDSDDDLEPYQAVSPNGDNDNDVFVIRNIEKFPNNTVSIFNRWGVAVYEVDGYGQNNQFFRGTSEGRITISQGEQLPVGTYFYVIEYKTADGVSKNRVGYIYLNR